jgi:peptide deformylase
MKLILDPNPILKQVAVEWDFSVDTNAEEVESEMIQIMKTFHGRGLAGNQVGLLKRVFVIKLESTGETLAMFNPKVIESSNTEQDSEEGCLSFPNLWLKVKRPNKIDVEYLDKTGKECKITLTGIDARCFLHELDHLNGITFTNKVSQIKLLLARKQQRKNNGRTKR